MSLTLQAYFHEEAAAHTRLEEIVWPHGPVCPHCRARHRIGSVTGKGARIGLRFCCTCRKQFRATIGTVFEGSHVPLHKWFQACLLLHCCEYQINPHQLSVTIEVTYKTVSCLVRKLGTAQKMSATNRQQCIGAIRPRLPYRTFRAQRLFKGSAAASILDEDEVPSVMHSKPSTNQSANFAEVVRHLRPIKDPGLFDSVLTGLLDYDANCRRIASLSPAP